MGSDSRLHEAIGQIVVWWANLEATLDQGIRLLNDYGRLTGEAPDDEQVSSSRQFDRNRKHWKKAFRRIDLSAGQYDCDTCKTAAELDRHRQLRDLLVHGRPSMVPFSDADMVTFTMERAAKNAYFQASLKYKRQELERRGMSPAAVRVGLRQFMTVTNEILIPFSEISASLEYLPHLNSNVREAHLDLNRMISHKLNERLGEGPWS